MRGAARSGTYTHRSHRKCRPHIEEAAAETIAGKLTYADLFTGIGVKEQVEHAQLCSGDSCAQHTIVLPRNEFSGAGVRVEHEFQQAQGIGFCKAVNRAVPLVDESLRIRSFTAQRWFKFGSKIVVKAEKSAGKLFFEDGCMSEKGERPLLNTIGWNQEYLAFALKERSCDATVHGLGKGDGAVVESDVHVFTLDRCFTNVIDLRRVEVYVA
jgi:hypothetical protein